jgi:hypothetical protein
MRRVTFAEAFLEALGAVEVQFGAATDSSVEGTAVYDATDPEERQDFRWHATEDDVPSDDAVKLLKLIRDEKLLSVDKLRVSRDELQRRYETRSGKSLRSAEFSQLLESIEAIEMPMLDGGNEEGDCFFSHE